MNKQRKTSHILNVFQYDADGHVILPATLTIGENPHSSDNTNKIPSTAWVRTYVSGLSYQGAITLTNTGSSGAASLLSNTLNIPTYTLAGLGGEPAITAGTTAQYWRGDKSFQTLNTTVVTEGTNLYYTDARVLAYLTANNYATQSYVGTQIANLVDAAPGTLDTLNELAAALGDDPNFATTIATSIGTKQAQLNGTGFVKVSGTTVSYDNSTYLTTSSAASTYVSLSGSYANPAWITSLGWSKITSTPTTISGYGITNAYTDAQIQNFFNGANAITGYNKSNWDTAYGWGNHASGGYLTTASAASTYVSLTGSYANPSWITSLAYSKITGVPAFLTSYTETDTLATVTARGSSTTAGINVNGRLTAAGAGTYAVTGSSTQRYIMQALNTSNSVNAAYGWWWFHNTNGDMGFHADAVGDILTLTRGGGASVNGNTILTAGNYTSYTYSTTDADSRFLRGTTNPGSVNNFTISIGNNGSYSYVQSHSGQPLELNPVGNTVRIAGNIALHAGNYASYSPSLTGSGASGTWGISITGNAATLGGYGPNQTGGAYTIVQRDSNGYIQNSYFYTSGGGSERGTGISYIAGFNSSDYYIRSYTLQGLASAMSGVSMNISGNATTANGANGNFYIDDNYGNTVVGVYASTRYQGVFAMGDSYKLPADGTSTGSLYGLAWSHPNAGGVAGNLNTHGLLVMENGTFLAAVSGSIRARDDMRAPIFYDSNDTTYYVDPNGNSKLSNLGLGNVTPDLRLSVNGDSHMSGILYMGGTAGSYNSWGSRTYTSSGLWYNNSNGVEFNNYGYGSTWSFTINGGNAISSGSMRAPIFYDSNNTGYYLDPDDTSNLYRFSEATLNRHSLNSRQTNSPWSTRAAQGTLYQTGAMGWGSIDLNTIGSYWGSGFFDTWSSPSNGPGASSHYVGMQAMHYNDQNGNFHGWQMACAQEASNRWFWRSSWNVPNRPWVEMIHSGNIGSQSVGYASSSGNAASVYNGTYGVTGNNGYFDTVNTGSSGDPLELNYYRTGNVYIGPNGGDNTVRASSFYLYNSGGQIYAINGSYIGYSTWLQSSGTHGLYSPSSGSGTHWYPAASYTYGSWYMEGFRNGYLGILLYGTAGPVTIMYDSSGNGGVYQQGDDWHYYWSEGNRCLGVNGSGTSSSYALYVNNKGIYTAGDVVAYSDIRKKKDIVTIEHALDKVLDMRGVFYTRVDQEEKGRQTGVIAQEVETVLPEVVTYAKDVDEYGVAYGNMAGLFIEAFKEQQKLIQNLRLEIEVLKSKI